MKVGMIVGTLFGVVALILAIVALATAPESSGDLKPEIAALKGEMARVSTELADLSTKLGDLSARVSRAERAVAATPAPAAEVDEAQVREILRDEMRAQMERFRAGAAGGPGGGGRGLSAEALRENAGIEGEKAERVAQIQGRLQESIRNLWRDNRGGDREQNVEQMHKLQREAEEQIAKILTPEEMETFKQYMDRFGRGRGDQGGRGRNRREREEDRPAEEEGGEGGAF